MKIINKYNTGVTIPDSENLELGEIALSTDNTNPKIFIKDSGNTIHEIVDKSKLITFDTGQTLTDSEKDIVNTNLGIMDEIVTLSLECEDESVISGVSITVSIEDNKTIYYWEGTPIIFTIPMFATYSILCQKIDGYDAPDKISRIAQRNCKKSFNLAYTSSDFYDLSLYDAKGNIMTSRETANCYIVYSAGTYGFPLVYGCGIKNGIENTESFQYVERSGWDTVKPFYNYLNTSVTSCCIEEDTNIDADSAEVLYYDISSFTIENIHFESKFCKYVVFDLTEFPTNTGGNAIIAIKDASGQIMWSWHIWAAFDKTIGDSGYFTNNNGNVYEILRYPLGYVKSDTTGTCVYYQWGRKDPMLRATSYTNYVDATTYPNNAFTYASSYANNVAEAIQNPTKIYKACGTNGAWWGEGSTHNYLNYWDPYLYYYKQANDCTKTIYDPCPIGFSVPTYKTFNGVTSTTFTWDDGYIIGGYVKRPFGYRNYSVGGLRWDGYYWCAGCDYDYTERSYFPVNLYFSKIDSTVTITPNHMNKYIVACPIMAVRQ